MQTETVSVDRLGAVAVLTLDRPAKANTINVQMLLDLREVFADLVADDEVRALVVTGRGRHFCGGWDLAASSGDVPAGLDVNTCFGMVTKPVIAAINGAAVGGGCEIALASDVRFMSRTASIGLPEITFGELPAAGATVRLPRLVGASQAKRLILTGDTLSAEDALRIGLVDEVTGGDVVAAAVALAERMASRAPYAVRAAKFLIDRTHDVDELTALALEKQVVATMADSATRALAREQATRDSGTYARIFADR